MPTYDYECALCDHTFELFQQITEDPVRNCPKCGKKKVQRLVGTGGAVIFKGSGFYQTDYRSKDYKSKLDADNKSSDISANKSKDKDSKKAGKDTKKEND